ncbi:MAG TPA: radical SAM protein [Candidatus Limnocylindria bacterium]|nr:radical SAM protein [Candidatus Limnocylindria bacterium]
MASLRDRWRRLVASEAYQQLVALPPQRGYYRVTPRRLANLYLGRLEYLLGRKRLRSNPVKLTVESTSACNLRCPACFTGAGETGRPRGAMPLALYERLLDELGPYLFEIEFHNWGEPLLAKHLVPMIERAARLGIATTVSTNFSMPFDAERAEALVRSGLSLLGVSIDGARQATYEQYRVRGDLELVLQNCRLVRDARRRLGSPTPRLIWEFHVFAHNAADVPLARAMAAELEMEISVDKGWVVGEEWDRGGDFAYFFNPRPYRCPFLWRHAVVNNDGGVAPCCGTFYAEDDRGRLATAAGVPGAASFREVWNNDKFALARRFFDARTGSEAERRDVCFDCPITVSYELLKQHRAAGGRRADFQVPYSTNDCFNYFWERRPRRSAGSEAAS